MHACTKTLIKGWIIYWSEFSVRNSFSLMCILIYNVLTLNVIYKTEVYLNLITEYFPDTLSSIVRRQRRARRYIPAWMRTVLIRITYIPLYILGNNPTFFLYLAVPLHVSMWMSQYIWLCSVAPNKQTVMTTVSIKLLSSFWGHLDSTEILHSLIFTSFRCSCVLIKFSEGSTTFIPEASVIVTSNLKTFSLICKETCYKFVTLAGNDNIMIYFNFILVRRDTCQYLN